MIQFRRAAISALLAGTFLATPLLAAGTHPVTGAALAGDQTFTRRVLDEEASVDPQVVEDLTASKIVRALFEGLPNEDADGVLVPRCRGRLGGPRGQEGAAAGRSSATPPSRRAFP
jgi:oligopeptide transport system substrate-binding protein